MHGMRLRAATSATKCSSAPPEVDALQARRFSIRHRVGGLGRGLSLVRHISELHGGHVIAESAGVGHGSTFTVVLPLRAIVRAESADVEPEQAVATSNAKLLTDIRLLVVDDEPDARDLLALVLTEAGALVHVAGSASAGFTAF